MNITQGLNIDDIVDIDNTNIEPTESPPTTPKNKNKPNDSDYTPPKGHPIRRKRRLPQSPGEKRYSQRLRQIQNKNKNQKNKNNESNRPIARLEHNKYKNLNDIWTKAPMFNVQDPSITNEIWIKWVKKGFYGPMSKYPNILQQEQKTRIGHHRQDEYECSIYEVFYYLS